MSRQTEAVTFMRRALRLARQAYGRTSPNPLVGAVLVKAGRIIGQGWHHQAGEPHAEIEALNDAAARGHKPAGATLYVTLEPCSTSGRTPPCTDALCAARIRRIVAGATDPNPAHAGRGFAILARAGIEVTRGILAEEATVMNEPFNHWIVTHRPFVQLKTAMTLDGRIATARGESQWITGEKARACGMRLRQGADAILVGVNTVLADNPRLSFRPVGTQARPLAPPRLRRIILDSKGRTPLSAQVVTDSLAQLTTIVLTSAAPAKSRRALERHVQVWVSPIHQGRINLHWLLDRLGSENVTHLLIEGGGEINASFLMQRLVQRITFFYAPKILGGNEACRAVAGRGIARLRDVLQLRNPVSRKIGEDWMLTARVD